MKLTDLTYKIGSVVRDATNVVRYPLQIAVQKVRDASQEKLEQIEVSLPGRKAGKSERQAQNTQTTAQTRQIGQSASELVQSFDGNGFVVTQAPIAHWAEPSVVLPRECSGRRGKYRLDEPLNETSVPVYRGVWLQNQMPVLIQEYLFNQFSPDAMRQRRETLERLESVRLKNSTGQDFRLIAPWDMAIAVAEKRGYLITQYCPDKSKTLNDHLKQYLAMPARQVRQVLLQVLQTLWFLHNHPIRFTDGTVQYGLLHGNLSLDSLMIASDPQPINGQELAFYIYVKDLALWQIPFQSPMKATTSSLHNVPLSFETLQAKFFQRDLASLGAVGVCLLTGDRSDRAFQPEFDPDGEPRWDDITDAPLKKFIRQLLGRDPSRFGSAEAAYRELLNPVPEASKLLPAAVAPEATEKTQRTGCLWLLILGLLLGLGGWCLLRSLSGQSPIVLMSPKPPPTAIRDVPNLKKLPLYPVKLSVSNAWRDAIGVRRSSFKKSLLNELGDRSNSVLNRFRVQEAPQNRLDLQHQLESGELAFALSDSIDDLSSQNLEQTLVAYDGIAVFVAFSDVYRNKNIPKQLHGEITLEQLQTIYTDSNRSYNPQFPQDAWVTTLFQNLLFPDDSRQNNDFIQNFERLKNRIGSKPINAILKETLKETFGNNNQPIRIGFARISQVYGQCSVYPLAIKASGRSVQAFVQDNGKPIEPELDLCNTKGGYWADPDVVASQYPFTYKLSVVYAKANARSKQAAEAFIAALKTDEGQCLLSEAGLVPLSSVRKAAVCQSPSPS